MSNEDDFDDDDLDADGGEGGNGNAPKVLRKQNRELKAQLETERKEREALAAKVRQRDVADALEEFGANKKIAKYVDIEDTSPEAVRKWLEENGEDFGWTPNDDDDDLDENEQDRQNQARRIARATREAPDSRTPVITPEFIKTASREDLIAAGVIARS